MKKALEIAQILGPVKLDIKGISLENIARMNREFFKVKPYLR